MTRYHPEIGVYWDRVAKASEDVYQQYLRDVSVTRVSLRPKKVINRTSIETRIEWKLRGMLVSAVPSTVNQQCMFEQDVTCAQILYRTMVLAGPANSDDRKQMHDMLTQPKVIEVGKLHEHLVMWQFARNRLTKYGFQEPDASQLFETLK